MGGNLRSGRLYGRDAELVVLCGGLRRAALGEGQVMIVEGEAGIGKTRLLDTALTAIGGFRVIRGAAEELERTAPFLAFARALQSMNPPPGGRLRIVTDLLLGTTPSDEDPVTPSRREVGLRVLDQLALGVEELATAGSVLVAVEDLQWADPSTLLAVRLLGRRVAQLPMAVVVTLRPTPRSAELSGVVDDLIVVGGAHLILRPLDVDAVAALLGDVIGATPGTQLRAQAARAGGNPLFVRELAAALIEAELLDVADGRVELREPALPASLGPTILRRLRFLPDQTLHALRVAAVLGSSFDLSDLAVCLGRSAVELLPAVQEATEAGILSEVDGRLAFRHDLIWEVLYQDLAAPVRKALHLEAGRALAGAGRPPRQVAPHLAIGAPAGDRQAVAWLQRAARQAAPLAPAVAAELLERALQLADPSDPCRDTLRAELAAALVWSGRPRDAEKLARQTLADPAGVAAGSLQWALAEALQVQGRLHEALPYIEAAAGHPGLPEGQRARLLADAAQWRFYTGDADAAAVLAHHAVAAGEACSDDIAVCLGLSALSRMATERLDLPEGISLARPAVERARERGVGRIDSTWIHPTFDLGGALLVADELTEAEQVLQGGIRLREELGSTWDLPLFINALAHAHLYAGRWDDAVAEATTVLTLAEEGRASASIM
jgi:tetratricopeptide (TPR) repeat protein